MRSIYIYDISSLRVKCPETRVKSLGTTGLAAGFFKCEVTVYHQRKEGLKTADNAGLVPIFSVWNDDITTEKNASLGCPELLLLLQ